MLLVGGGAVSDRCRVDDIGGGVVHPVGRIIYLRCIEAASASETPNVGCFQSKLGVLSDSSMSSSLSCIMSLVRYW